MNSLRSSMRVLVAGGSGLVGRSLLRKAPPQVEIFAPSRSDLDLRNLGAVKKYLETTRIDSVLMAAAQVGGIGANNKDQYGFLYNNLLIQNGVIEAARAQNVQNFLFLGSSCIYPKNLTKPISENSILTGTLEETNEGYAIAKIAGVKMCAAISKEYDLNFFSLMPTNLYGPFDNFNINSSHVPAALMRKFHEAKIGNLPSVTVWGTGAPLRDFMHVDDLAKACWHFLHRPLEVGLINIGTGNEISILDFAHLISREVGFTGKIVFDESKPDGTSRKLLNIDLAKKFGWESSISLQTGIRSTYNWFRDAYSKGEFRE